MKKIILILLVSFSNMYSANNISVLNHVNEDQQRKTVYGQLLTQGQFVRAQVQYIIKQNGIECDIAYVNGERIELYRQKFKPLNPNNEMAVRFNFTHFVTSSKGTIYVILM